MITIREMIEEEGIDCSKADETAQKLMCRQPTFARLHVLCIMGAITKEQEKRLVDRMDREAQHGEE